MKTNRILKNCSPLCFMADGRLLCYHYGKLIIMKDGDIIKRISLFDDYKETVVGRIRLAYRLLRLGIRAVEEIDENHIVVSKGSSLYEIDLRTGEKSSGFFCGKGRRPLIFSYIRDVEGFTDGVYYGDYLGVFENAPINIKRRIGKDIWEDVYLFPAGTIDHIHNIVPDRYRQCVWIFTGDFGEASAIWKVSDNFQTVQCVASNDQKYRGCVVFAVREGLLYATDAPFADNYIYLFNTSTYKSKPLQPIHGSCIYGCQWKKKYVFSTTVEGEMFKTKKDFWFSRKKGAGIKDDDVHMYVGVPSEGFWEIYKERKDSLPFYSFQFGVFKFPYGLNDSDTLYFQPIATKRNDLSLMALDYTL